MCAFKTITKPRNVPIQFVFIHVPHFFPHSPDFVFRILVKNFYKIIAIFIKLSRVAIAMGIQNN